VVKAYDHDVRITDYMHHRDAYPREEEPESSADIMRRIGDD
jgi:hypothetical protein